MDVVTSDDEIYADPSSSTTSTLKLPQEFYNSHSYRRMSWLALRDVESRRIILNQLPLGNNPHSLGSHFFTLSQLDLRRVTHLNLESSVRHWEYLLPNMPNLESGLFLWDTVEITDLLRCLKALPSTMRKLEISLNQGVRLPDLQEMPIFSHIIFRIFQFEELEELSFSLHKGDFQDGFCRLSDMACKVFPNLKNLSLSLKGQATKQFLTMQDVLRLPNLTSLKVHPEFWIELQGVSMEKISERSQFTPDWFRFRGVSQSLRFLTIDFDHYEFDVACMDSIINDLKKLESLTFCVRISLDASLFRRFRLLPQLKTLRMKVASLAIEQIKDLNDALKLQVGLCDFSLIVTNIGRTAEEIRRQEQALCELFLTVCSSCFDLTRFVWKTSGACLPLKIPSEEMGLLRLQYLSLGFCDTTRFYDEQQTWWECITALVSPNAKRLKTLKLRVDCVTQNSVVNKLANYVNDCPYLETITLGVNWSNLLGPGTRSLFEKVSVAWNVLYSLEPSFKDKVALFAQNFNPRLMHIFECRQLRTLKLVFYSSFQVNWGRDWTVKLCPDETTAPRLHEILVTHGSYPQLKTRPWKSKVYHNSPYRVRLQRW